MSVDRLSSFYFQSLVIEYLSIKSTEYCYFIPIVSQLADYVGNVKLAFLCKKMSKRTKQNLSILNCILVPSFYYLDSSNRFRNVLLNPIWKEKKYSENLEYSL